MKVLCEQQGTPDWHRARMSRVSASEMGAVLARKGTKRRNVYMLDLALGCEGIEPIELADPPPWFALGRAYEDDGRRWYVFQTGAQVRQTGFVVHDDYAYLGCSPDGLLDPDGLVEIKCRHSLRTFHDHTSRVAIDVMRQIQFQLFVTDRAWCDYVNYWTDPDQGLEKGHIRRITRDQAMIDHLAEQAVKFYGEVLQLLERRRARVS